MSAKGDRIKNSLRNSACGLFFYALSMVLSFISNRAFIHNLGAELFGLNNTLFSIMEMLNLAELGVASAMASFLYAPLANNDRQTVAELVSLQGWIYRRVALFILVASSVVALLVPLIFSSSDVPIPYALATVFVLLLGSLSTYLLNFREVILDADQRNSDVVFAYRLPAVIRLTLQILAIEFTPYGYELWLVLQLLGYAMTAVLMRRAVKSRYPHFLHLDVAGAGPLRHKYPEVFRRVGQVFAHRLAYVVLVRVSPLTIFAFTSLSVVAAYGNYILIYGGLTMLLYTIQEGFQGSIGNLVAQSDREENGRVFAQLLAVDCLLGAVCAFGFFSFSDAFVALWVGPEMVLDCVTVAALSVMVFITVSRAAITQFLQAHGFFDDVWAAFTEAGLNVSLSILFGMKWGLPGVLCGVVSSLVLIVLIWKPFYLFRVKRCGSLVLYWCSWLSYVFVAAVAAVGFSWLFRSLEPLSSLSFFALLWRMAWQSVLYALALFVLFLLFSSPMRKVAMRLLGIIRSRLF